MSFQAMSWAVSQKCGSAAAKMVLMMLANHTNGHTNRCNPRHKTLAEECEMRVETLKNHLKHLEEIGLITIIPQFSDGVQLANHYALEVEGGGGVFHPGGGGENRMGGGGVFRTTVKQEDKQEYNQGESRKRSATIDRPSGVAQQTWADWLQLRKAKKAPVTETVVKSAVCEAEKAGVTLERFLQIWCARGSQGLEASWLKESEKQIGSVSKTSKHSGFATMDYTQGIEEDGTFV